MLCIFTSDVVKLVEDAVDAFAKATTASDEGGAAAKLAGKLKARVSKRSLRENQLDAALAALTVEGKEPRLEDLDSKGGGLCALRYFDDEFTSMMSRESGKLGDISCWFTGTLAKSRAARLSEDMPPPEQQNENKLLQRRQSTLTGTDAVTQADFDCLRIVETYSNVALSSSLGGLARQSRDFSQTDSMGAALARLRGTYSFVIYDRQRRRIVVARDRSGALPMFWTTDEDGTRLFFSTSKEALLKEHPEERVMEFPPGSTFISKSAELSGTLDGKLMKDIRYIWMPRPRASLDGISSGSLGGRRTTGTGRSSVEMIAEEASKLVASET